MNTASTCLTRSGKLPCRRASPGRRSISRSPRRGLRTGDLDGAIDLSRAVIDDLFAAGEMIYRGPATAALVDALLRRDSHSDVQQAQAAIDRLAAVPTDP